MRRGARLRKNVSSPDYMDLHTIRILGAALSFLAGLTSVVGGRLGGESGWGRWGEVAVEGLLRSSFMSIHTDTPMGASPPIWGYY